VTINPFRALGLPVRPDLTDDDVRVAWRRIAAQTHPDRPDGGDRDRFAAAAAAYTTLRTRYGRGEAYADVSTGAWRDASAGARAGAASAPAPAPAPASGTGTMAGTQVPPATGSSRNEQAGELGGRPGFDGARVGPGPGLAFRVRRGRPALLGLRLAITAAIIAVAFAVTGTQPAAIGLTIGALTWFFVTARRDLAPPGR
jgi:hypothetical protein